MGKHKKRRAGTRLAAQKKGAKKNASSKKAISRPPLQADPQPEENSKPKKTKKFRIDLDKLESNIAKTGIFIGAIAELLTAFVAVRDKIKTPKLEAKHLDKVMDIIETPAVQSVINPHSELPAAGESSADDKANSG
jgi:hypothetical protein